MIISGFGGLKLVGVLHRERLVSASTGLQFKALGSLSVAFAEKLEIRDLSFIAKLMILTQ